MSEKIYVYPFTAIVGQDTMKEGILLISVSKDE